MRHAKECIDYVNTIDGSLLVTYGAKEVGRVIPDSMEFKNEIFYMRVELQDDLLNQYPDILDRIFCLLPCYNRMDHEDLYTKQDGKLFVHQVGLLGVVICDQLYRPDIKLLSFIDYVETDIVRPKLYATICKKGEIKTERVHVCGERWFLESEMPPVNKNRGRYFP